MDFGCKYSKMIFFGRENRQKVNGGARPGRVRGAFGAGRGGAESLESPESPAASSHP